MSSNFLEKILAHKRQEIEQRRARSPEIELRHMSRDLAPPLDLLQALRIANRLAVIAEMKKASPSAGVLRPSFDPLQIAQSYVAAGAEAISVLTDEEFFQGSLQYLERIRPFVDVPLLRKDFIISPYQIHEARAFGADAILLIVAALSHDDLYRLLEVTHELGMYALVEVHEAQEMEQALSVDAKIIGINNRSLKTFEIDLRVTEQLAPRAGKDITLVAESGLRTESDVQRMKAAGVHALLVGTHFMQANDPGEALREFRRLCCA
ncbi:indole-3-glycerol phosphate synthase TrpC [candidate division KSB1 bacterium]|nr:indole-3-glycerol phosphate synthase TrpC [candidate division KSB1 bacterium]